MARRQHARARAASGVAVSRPIDVISLYGAANAGVRARAFGFLERLDVPFTLHCYFDSNAAGLRQFVRHPVRAAAAEWDLRRLVAAGAETVILCREASPLSKGELESRLLRSARHAVYDIDDSFHDDVRSPVFEALFSKGRKAEKAVAVADVVVVGNEYLAEWASKRAKMVRVIPTCVDPGAYVAKSNYELADPPRLLWLGTPSGERYLRLVEPALRRLHDELGVTLMIIGDTRPRLGRLESLIARTEWSLAGVSETIADYDVGIMPLEDSSYERGKCAYKLLEYGAAGLPVVASPVGVNARILAASGNAAPSTASEWYDALRDLLSVSAATRRTRGRSLLDVVGREFTFGRWLAAWRSAVAL